MFEIVSMRNAKMNDSVYDLRCGHITMFQTVCVHSAEAKRKPNRLVWTKIFQTETEISSFGLVQTEFDSV
jgi:hypothetical protein